MAKRHWSCFLLTLKALLIPLAPARAASLRRVIAVVFGVTLSRSAYYRFMASARLPWKALWVRLWRGTPSPLTDGSESRPVMAVAVAHAG